MRIIMLVALVALDVLEFDERDISCLVLHEPTELPNCRFILWDARKVPPLLCQARPVQSSAMRKTTRTDSEVGNLLEVCAIEAVDGYKALV